jgi:hypothetical protein
LSLLTARLNPYDILLVIVVSIQAVSLAYMRQPRWKAFLLSLPVPFTLMTLAIGSPIDATNILGLFFLLLFTHGVRVFYKNLGIPIIPAITLAALIYCLLSSLVVPILPRTDTAFWLAWVFTVSLGAFLYLWIPERDEIAYRTELPVWIKMPMIVVIVVLLVMVRNTIQGFATVFPMVGVIAVYESRYCLWTIGRQIPVIMVSIGSMMAVAYLIQPHWGLFLALLAGWSVFVLVFGAFTIQMWSKIRSSPESSLAG